MGQGFLCSEKLLNEKNAKPCKWPDLQLYFAPLSFFALSQSMLTRASNVKPEFFSTLLGSNVGKDGFYFVIALVRPHSKGLITLKDNNPLSPPVIDPKYLEDPRDVNSILKGKGGIHVFDCLILCTSI